MKHRFLVWVFLIMGSFAAMGCAGSGPPWVVVTQAVPNPVAGQRELTLEPVSFEGLVVGEMSEASYLADKDEEKTASFRADKEALATRFAQKVIEALAEIRIVNPPGNGKLVVRPHVTFIEGGYFALVRSRAAEVRMTLQILDTQGTILDEIKLTRKIGGSFYNASSGGRLRDAADQLGADAAAYLRSRIFPEGSSSP